MFLLFLALTMLVSALGSILARLSILQVDLGFLLEFGLKQFTEEPERKYPFSLLNGL